MAASIQNTADATSAGSADRIPAEVWRLAAVVVLGGFMSMLDTNIVNIGLESIGHSLRAPLSEVQWVVSGYLVALAAIIPVTGWTATRFGAARVWLVSLAAFTLISVLCAVVGSAGLLIVCRVLQGVSGGLLVPAGQMLLAVAAGPRRMGRVMSVVGIAVAFAPVLGPTVGGLVLAHASWRWLFLINVPVGAVGMAAGLKVLPRGAPRRAERLDVLGLVLVCSGLPLLVYGIERTTETASVTTPAALITLVCGAVLLAGFIRHALRVERPLLNLRLFRGPAYSAAMVSTFCSGALLFGALVVLPLYFEIGRGQGTLAAGLLLVPQGLGAVIALPLSGVLTDRIGGGLVATGELLIALVATVPLALAGAHTPYWWLCLVLFVRGFGVTAYIPTMSAAYAVVAKADIPHTTPQLNMVQRVGGAVGAALMAVVFGTRLGPVARATFGDAVRAFDATMWWLVAVTALAVVPALMLARAERPAAR